MFTKFQLWKAFSGQVIRHREQRALTQTQLADAVSTSLRWIQRIETGVRLPGFFLAVKIIAFLEIDANALIAALMEQTGRPFRKEDANDDIPVQAH